jgi:hypothetical protein
LGKAARVGVDARELRRRKVDLTLVANDDVVAGAAGDGVGTDTAEDEIPLLLAVDGVDIAVAAAVVGLDQGRQSAPDLLEDLALDAPMVTEDDVTAVDLLRFGAVIAVDGVLTEAADDDVAA